MTAMSGLTQDRNENILPFHSRSSSTRATMGGSPTNTLRSNPPQSNKSAAISVDSGISRLSQSASLSAVATAGGLTVNTPLPSMNGQRNGQREEDNDNNDENMMSVAHAPPPLGMGRFNMTTTTSNNNNHYLHSQHPPHSSSNTSIDAQVGSMPPLTDPSVGSQKSTPLHQRRNGLSAPPSLAIPFA